MILLWRIWTDRQEAFRDNYYKRLIYRVTGMVTRFFHVFLYKINRSYYNKITLQG